MNLKPSGHSLGCQCDMCCGIQQPGPVEQPAAGPCLWRYARGEISLRKCLELLGVQDVVNLSMELEHGPNPLRKTAPTNLEKSEMGSCVPQSDATSKPEPKTCGNCGLHMTYYPGDDDSGCYGNECGVPCDAWREKEKE